MVCCIALSMLIAGVVFVLRLPRLGIIGRDNALAWRPGLSEPSDVHTRKITPSFSLAARFRSFAFAVEGLWEMVRNEHNARIHLAVTIAVIFLSVLLDLRYTDWRWIIACVCWVWFAEAVNTALEHLCDVVSPGRNDAVRLSKDVAAGAVLVSSCMAVIVGAMTFFPYLSETAYPHFDSFSICRAR